MTPENDCCTQTTRNCQDPTPSLTAEVDGKYVCCPSSGTHDISGNLPTCPGSKTDKVDLYPDGCCMTPEDAPACVKGTTLTGSRQNNEIACCINPNFVMIDNMTPQCTDSYVSDSNSANGVAVSVSMVGAAIVAAQMF